MRKGLYIFGLVLLLFTISCERSSRSRPAAVNGYQDLSGWDFSKDGLISLNGTWKFYWNRLLTPEELQKDSIGTVPYNLAVPGVWNSLTDGTTRLPGQGFGTYYLKIRLNHSYDHLGIKIRDVSSSYKLWINGQLVAENGMVSTAPDEVKPQMLPMVRIFNTQSDQIELVVQVANYFHHRGGMWESIQVGTPEQVIEARESSLLLTMFFAGTVFILFIYHLWIYLFRRTEKAALWFGILCFIVLLRTLQINERIIYDILPNLSINLGYRLEYINIFCLIPVSFALYYYYLFEIRVLKAVLRVIVGVSLVELLLILFLPTPVYTSFAIIYQVVLYFILVYFFILTFNQISIRKKGARLLLLCWLLLLLSGLNDILFLNLVINTFQFSHYAFFIFIVAQAYILSYKFAGAYKEIEDLSVNLELKVAQRTHELEEEKKKSDKLLLNILPVEVAQELKLKGRSDAKTFSMVTVMFTDFKDFTKVSERESAELLVAEIDHCFSGFDNIIQKYGIEKIKTVGDAYICAGGMPVLTYTHALDIVNAALEIRDFMLARKAEKEARGEIPFEMRIGIHTGPVVAGIVGIKKFAYDIWGDTVNIAARMESSGEAGKVNISGTTYQLVKDHFECTYRGKVQAKNKGEIDMYFAERIAQANPITG